MIADAPVVPMIPTTDRARSREFYEQVLGLKLTSDTPHALEFSSGSTTLVVYETMAEISAQHTLATWKVKDVASEVAELKSKGVQFEEYDMPGLKTENSIASDESGTAAWFKDPDGNILALLEGGE